MSSLSSSVVSMASRATNEEEENNKNDQIKTMKLIKGIVDNEREENKNMKKRTETGTGRTSEANVRTEQGTRAIENRRYGETKQSARRDEIHDDAIDVDQGQPILIE